MSMHLVPGTPGLNTKRNKKKLSNKQQKALAEHDKWLRLHGLHSDQIAKRKAIKKTSAIVDQSTDQQVKISSLGNGFAPISGKKSVFDSVWQKRYDDNPELARREAIALEQAELKKSRVAPAFSKGAYQFISEDTDLSDLGKKK